MKNTNQEKCNFLNQENFHSSIKKIQNNDQQISQLTINFGDTIFSSLNLSQSLEKMQQIINVIQNNTCITTCALCGIKNIQDDNEKIKIFAELLTKSKFIKNLSLYWNDISDIAIQYFANALAKNTSINTLKLDNNSISNKGIFILINALKENTTINQVEITYLSSDGFSDNIEKFIIQEMHQNSSKQVLQIINTIKEGIKKRIEDFKKNDENNEDNENNIDTNEWTILNTPPDVSNKQSNTLNKPQYINVQYNSSVVWCTKKLSTPLQNIFFIQALQNTLCTKQNDNNNDITNKEIVATFHEIYSGIFNISSPNNNYSFLFFQNENEINKIDEIKNKTQQINNYLEFIAKITDNDKSLQKEALLKIISSNTENVKEFDSLAEMLCVEKIAKEKNIDLDINAVKLYLEQISKLWQKSLNDTELVKEKNICSDNLLLLNRLSSLEKKSLRKNQPSMQLQKEIINVHLENIQKIIEKQETNKTSNIALNTSNTYLLLLQKSLTQVNYCFTLNDCEEVRVASKYLSIYLVLPFAKNYLKEVYKEEKISILNIDDIESAGSILCFYFLVKDELKSNPIKNESKNKYSNKLSLLLNILEQCYPSLHEEYKNTEKQEKKKLQQQEMKKEIIKKIKENKNKFHLTNNLKKKNNTQPLLTLFTKYGGGNGFDKFFKLGKNNHEDNFSIQKTSSNTLQNN